MTDWRPNWRDSTAYPQRLTERKWRWEFLRRDEEYQDDFARLSAADFERQVEEWRDMPLPEGFDSWEQVFKPFAERPAIDAKPGCREKYGVAYLLNPALSKPGFHLFITECPHGVTFASEGSFREMETQGIKLMAFDLKQPIGQQLKQAGRHLKLIQSERYGQPRARRRHRAKWARYLRILDAKAAGVNAKQIAMRLELEPRADATDQFDPDRLVNENLKQAQAIQLRFKRTS